MSDLREDVVREWLDQHIPSLLFSSHDCDRPWSEHPKMLLAAIDAVAPTADSVDTSWLEMVRTKDDR